MRISSDLKKLTNVLKELVIARSASASVGRGGSEERKEMDGAILKVIKLINSC